MMSRTVIQPDAQELSDAETGEAVGALSKPLYRALVRVKADPDLHGQHIALFSFTPSVGATPNENGIYGIAKIRGTWGSAEQAEIEAERLIRQTDSANEILHVKVGQDFPLTKDPKFTSDFKTVDLSEKVDNEVKRDQESRKAQEKQEIVTLKDREADLLKQTKEVLAGTFKENTLDVYIQAHVKRAQLTWTLRETERRIREEIMPALLKAKAEVKQTEEAHPEYKDAYKQHYLQARRDAGIKDDVIFGKEGAVGWATFLLDTDDDGNALPTISEEEEHKDY